MVSLVVPLLFAQPGVTDAGLGRAPIQVMAVIDGKGNLALTRVRPLGGFGPPAAMPEIELPPGKADKGPAAVPVKVTSLAVTTIELPAAAVDAQMAAGKPITTEQLAELLAKERPILVATDGKKIDAFHLRLYKDDTIVLILAPAVGRFFRDEVSPLVDPPPALPPVPIDPPKKFEKDS